MTQLYQYERNILGINGADGIIAELVARTKIGCDSRPPLAVELGAGCEHGNCYLLAAQNWEVLFVDVNPNHLAKLMVRLPGARISFKSVRVSMENVNQVVPPHADFVSIDVDGIDYWIWSALRATPAIMVVEFNAKYPPPQKKSVPYAPLESWDGTEFFGASLSAMYDLAKSRGYVFLGTDHEQVNAYFVHRDFPTGLLATTPEACWRPPTIPHPASDRPMVEVP